MDCAISCILFNGNQSTARDRFDFSQNKKQWQQIVNSLTSLFGIGHSNSMPKTILKRKNLVLDCALEIYPHLNLMSKQMLTTDSSWGERCKLWKINGRFACKRSPHSFQEHMRTRPAAILIKLRHISAALTTCCLITSVSSKAQDNKNHSIETTSLRHIAIFQLSYSHPIGMAQSAHPEHVKICIRN